MTGPKQNLQLTGVSFLNSRPLVAGLEAGIAAPFAYTYRPALPADAADILGRGEAVAGLVPVAALPALAGFHALPDLGVACNGAVRSVLVVSRVAPERISRLAVHSASRTSAALARLLLAERWDVRPEIVTVDPPLATMLATADAALVIGDPALALAGHTGLVEIDLGEAWQSWTGLPFVFAAWAVPDHASDAIAGLLHASYAWACAHFDTLLPIWAHDHGVTVEAAHDYLGTTLHFVLGEREREALATFLARAARADVLGAPNTMGHPLVAGRQR